jgi:hypothetical protein
MAPIFIDRGFEAGSAKFVIKTESFKSYQVFRATFICKCKDGVYNWEYSWKKVSVEETVTITDIRAADELEFKELLQKMIDVGKGLKK